MSERERVRKRTRKMRKRTRESTRAREEGDEIDIGGEIMIKKEY